IIVDYHMSGMDGIETIKKIKGMGSSAQIEQPFVILYSSSDNEAFQTECDLLSISARLVKPVKMHDLYRVLAKYNKEMVELTGEGNQANTKQQSTQAVKILIAEDNEINLFLTKTLIQQI